MSGHRTGSVASYTWSNDMIEGRRRLALLERFLDPSTFRRLESIDVRDGWHCLDVGAGGGTVCEWMRRRVGPSGLVTAMDLDARFLRTLACANLDVREENVVDAELRADHFDLIHARWTLMHIPERDAVIRKLVASLKGGGTLFLEEADIDPVLRLDKTGWHDVFVRVMEVIALRGSNGTWARELPFKLLALGLRDLHAESEFPYFLGRSELAEFWKISWGKVRDGVAAAGKDVSQWNRELAELDDPTRLFVAPMTVSVIATKA